MRILILLSLITLVSCNLISKSNSEVETFPAENLKGTWQYETSKKWVHLSNIDSGITFTRCEGKFSQQYNIDGNVLLEEDGTGYWNIADEHTLYRDSGNAKKVDSKPYFSFGNIDITIGNNEIEVLNTIIETTDFCTNISKSDQVSVDIYAEDHSQFTFEITFYSNDIQGNHSVELGQVYGYVTWIDVSNTTHIEWLDSGTIECAFSAESNLLCNIDAKLILSGEFKGDFEIDEIYLPN